MATEERNVLGAELTTCSAEPETGFLRDGKCRDLRRDPGRHEICTVMTNDFLEYSKSRGNDLMTPRPEMGFPGLAAGDRWCVCVPRWTEALEESVAPPVVLEATSEAVLEDVSTEALKEHAHRE